MNLLISVLAGILSSIIAVIIIELYRRTRKKYVHRTMRTVMQFVGSGCTIIVPAFPIKLPIRTSLISTEDAIALAYVLEVCSTLNYKADVMSSRRIENNLSSNIIPIGGPSGNDTTGTLLRNYCPGFHIHNADDFNNIYYECGNQRFDNDADHAVAFVIRLTPQLTQLSGTILLLWGHYGIGTSAAAYFVKEYPEVLAALRSESFFIVLSLNRSLGYRSVSKSITDVSYYAFNKQNPSSQANVSAG